jgi:hypothetical protein
VRIDVLLILRDHACMSASLACGWVTGCGKELRAHAERKRLSHLSIAITKCTIGNCSLQEWTPLMIINGTSNG